MKRASEVDGVTGRAGWRMFRRERETVVEWDRRDGV